MFIEGKHSAEGEAHDESIVRELLSIIDDVRYWHKKDARSIRHFTDECYVCQALSRADKFSKA